MRAIVAPAPASTVIGCGVDPAPAHVKDADLPPAFRSVHPVSRPHRAEQGMRDATGIFRQVSESDPAARQECPAGDGRLSNMPIPSHPRIKCLGVVDDAMRETLLSRARLPVVPSPFESLSMVLLEAWNQDCRRS